MKNILTYLISVVFVSVTSPAWAGSVTVPNTFVSGTPAKASEVNDNFSAVKSAVNDNDGRITTNTTNISNKQDRVIGTCPPGRSIRVISANGLVTCEPDNSSAVKSINSGTYTLTDSYTDAASISVNVPANGYVLVMASGMIQLTAKSAGFYSSIYVGVSQYTNTAPTASDYTKFYLDQNQVGSYEIPYSVQGLFQVTTGAYTFYLEGRNNGTSGSGTLFYSRLTALFIPMGM